ncbi:MAG: hypothetical protein ACLFT9_21435, partial [Coleofasciculus sp.]
MRQRQNYGTYFGIEWNNPLHKTLGKIGNTKAVDGLIAALNDSHSAILNWGRAGFAQKLSVICQRLVPKPAPTGYVDEGA